jgi:GTP-binding protein LepA
VIFSRLASLADGLQVITTKDEELLIDTPSKLPSPTERKSIEEPYVRVEMLAPTDYTGAS